MPKIAGHHVTTRELVALHAIYRGLLKADRTVYGVNVSRQLNSLAERDIISRSVWAYVIPYGSPGADIIAATDGFSISANI